MQRSARRSALARFSLATLIPLAAATSCSREATPHDGVAHHQRLDGRYASDMVVRDTRYSGSLELTTGRAGELSGTLELTSPIKITAQVSGSVGKDSITFGGPYRTPDCTGVLRARGRVADGGASAWGNLYIDDGCAGAMAGTFALRR